MRRGRLDIVADILQVIHNGNNKISSIMNKSRVSCHRFNQTYKTGLVESGLIKSRNNSQTTWVLTERGCAYLIKYKELEKLGPSRSRLGLR